MSTLSLMRGLAGGLLLAAGLALTACGGGGGAGGTGATASTTQSTKEVTAGTVTGFGSVIVDGVKYDDGSATVSIENDSASPKSGALSELRLGMRVEVSSNNGTSADTVVVGSEVIGQITSLAADGFVVAGQTVKITTTDPATVFEGVANLAGLAVNDLVEVHGTRDASGNIVATRVERRDPTTTAFVRVVGTIAGLDTTAKRFTIGGLTVTYDATTRILPAGTTLADGLRVAVWSDAAPSGNTLAARTLVVRRSGLSENDKARIGGLVRNLDFAAKTFVVDGISVDASGATFANGTAADLANGRYVRVRGTFSGGVMKATEVRYVRNQGDASVDLSGAITDFVSSASFKVRGVPVDASGTGVTFTGGDASGLANGVVVHVTGQVSANVVKATAIEFPTTPDGSVRSFAGVVSNYASTAGTFTLFNIGMKLSDTASFKNADGTAAARSDFGNGDRVLVRGSFAAGVFTVSAVVFGGGPSVVIDNVGGLAYDVDLNAGVFRLNGTLVRLGGTTSFQGTRSNLRNGVQVEVQGTIVNGELVAGLVTIKGPDDGVTAQARGDITDFVSVSSFRVAGQRVDASAATFSNGTAADLANGRSVEVKGPVVAGVLKAASVELK
jgi:hypothetical protein